VRYSDQKLLRDYAKLALQVAAAKNPDAKHDVSEAATLRMGYEMLRARMEQLSPKNRERFRYMLRSQINGVRTLMARAKANGEDVSLADVEISLFDAATRERVPDAPNVKLEEAEPEAGA
jgi:uncharacterized membrane protein